jgi:hypothetical protein
MLLRLVVQFINIIVSRLSIPQPSLIVHSVVMPRVQEVRYLVNIKLVFLGVLLAMFVIVSFGIMVGQQQQLSIAGMLRWESPTV